MASKAVPLLSTLTRNRIPRLIIPSSAHGAPLRSITARFAHNIPRPPAPPYHNAEHGPEAGPRRQTQQEHSESYQYKPGRTLKIDSAHYLLAFTCKPCGKRSQHKISKQGYHKGSTLITCPGCRNRHVMSDHLQIFGDRKIMVEDLMREKGRLVKKGTLGVDGNIEFWQDETPESEPKTLPPSDQP